VSYLAHGLGFGLGIILAILFFNLRREALRSHEQWIEPTPKNVELENYIDALEAQDDIDPLT
jgi:hypothetical protein